MTDRASFRSALTLPVLVGALGYFVDIFDLLLFPIIKTPSLQALGVPAAQQLEVGVRLLNWQMVGLLLGGILWGVLGDKRGRRSVLFGSIALYSAANIGNAFVHTLPAYAAFRFLAGLGLAGELGAAVTLVSEALPAEARGLDPPSWRGSASAARWWRAPWARSSRCTSGRTAGPTPIWWAAGWAWPCSSSAWA